MYYHDYDNIADRAKHAYARGTQLLAEMQYRLGELAGTGRLDPEESMALQWSLVRIWEQLYSGTTYAVRESVDYYDEFLDAGGDPADLDNHYSDGREVLTQIRVEPEEDAHRDWKACWEHNNCLVGDGAVNEHPRGTISHIAAPPEDARDDNGPVIHA
jgi:hypothetical protein